MSHQKDWYASALRRQIHELKTLLQSIEENSSPIPKREEYDLSVSSLKTVEASLRDIRGQIKIIYTDC